MQDYFLPLSPHTHTHTHADTQHILIWFLPKAWSQWSIVWVLFSSVTGGWDNGTQLNCAQLIYFYLRKQIDCTTTEGSLSLETPTKRSTEEDGLGRNLILPNFVNYNRSHWDLFPFFLSFFLTQCHLENAVAASKVTHSLHKQSNQGLGKEKINKGWNLFPWLRAKKESNLANVLFICKLIYSALRAFLPSWHLCFLNDV